MQDTTPYQVKSLHIVGGQVDDVPDGDASHHHLAQRQHLLVDGSSHDDPGQHAYLVGQQEAVCVDHRHGKGKCRDPCSVISMVQ